MQKRKHMAGNKSLVSKKGSYKEIGDYCDTHDLNEVEGTRKDATFSDEVDSDLHYFALDESLSSGLNVIAKKRGVSAEKLANLWLQERANQ